MDVDVDVLASQADLLLQPVSRQHGLCAYQMASNARIGPNRTPWWARNGRCWMLHTLGRKDSMQVQGREDVSPTHAARCSSFLASYLPI